jgi:hypothetical protein
LDRERAGHRQAFRGVNVNKETEIVLGIGTAVLAWFYGRPLLCAVGFTFLGTRSIRANNPGSIVDNGTQWVGYTGNDGGTPPLCTFDTTANGVRAMVINFQGYHLNTIDAIANKWSGGVAGYAQAASQASGFAIGQIIDPTDDDTAVAICKGIVYAENGPGIWVSDQTYAIGVSNT